MPPKAELNIECRPERALRQRADKSRVDPDFSRYRRKKSSFGAASRASVVRDWQAEFGFPKNPGRIPLRHCDGEIDPAIRRFFGVA
jgi:hypothetical protein